MPIPPPLSRPRALAATVISLLPTHRQPALPLVTLAKRLRQHTTNLSEDEALGVVTGVIAMLESFGLVVEENNGYRSVDQEPTYLLNSLRGLIELGEPIFGGWNGQGQPLREAIATQDLLNSPVHLLHLLETRRLALAQQNGLPTAPSRQQTVAFVLIKSLHVQAPSLLHQWDRRASQYQLIGGRVEPEETPLQAAHRELYEEVLSQQARIPSYTLQDVLHNNQPIRLIGLSRTYGALTDYSFYAFVAHFDIDAVGLTLGPQDRWVAIADMLNPASSDISDIGVLLNRQIPGGLAELPSSFR